MTSFEADRPAPAAVHSHWVIQKFGGTSVGKFALNIVEQVVQYDYPSTPSLPLTPRAIEPNNTIC